MDSGPNTAGSNGLVQGMYDTIFFVNTCSIQVALIGKKNLMLTYKEDRLSRSLCMISSE